MFGAKYSRLKFWIWSIILLIPFSLLSVFVKATETSTELAASNLIFRGLFLLVIIIWMNSLANRIRDYGSNPWISLFTLIPFVNIGLALYYGIVKAKNKPENNENIKKEQTSLVKAVINHSKDIVNEIKPVINEYKEKHNSLNTIEKETMTIVSNNLEINEDEIYEQIMIEIEEDKKVKSTWAKALAQSDGDDKKENSLYINLRFQEIKNEKEVINKQKELLNKQSANNSYVENQQNKSNNAKLIAGLIVSIIIFAVLSLAIGGAVYYKIQHDDKQSIDTNNKLSLYNEDKNNKKTEIYSADINDLILNLFDSRGKEKLMKLSFSLISNEPTIANIVENYKAEIIDIVISQVTPRSSDELLTIDGKKLLKDELMQDINNVINEAAASNSVIAKNNIKSIVFTTFIIK